MLCLTIGFSFTGCALFHPEWTESATYQPVQSAFQLRDNPPPALGLIDTNAVYVERKSFVRQESQGEIAHYRYLRFSPSGKVFLSRYHYPDSVDIQQALVTGEDGSYEFWTHMDLDPSASAEMRTQMEFYADALYLSTLRHTRVHEDSIVVYSEKTRRLFGFDNDEHIVYRKQTDVPPLPPLRWPK